MKKITFLMVAIAATMMTSVNAQINLPYSQDFSALTAGNMTSTGGSGTAVDLTATPLTGIAAVDKAYQAGGVIRFGTSSAVGGITTNTVNVGTATQIKVSFKAVPWTAATPKPAKVVVTYGTASQEIELSAAPSNFPLDATSFTTYSATFTANTTPTAVNIASISAGSTYEIRFFMDDLAITDASGSTLKVATPTFSPDGGSFTAPVSVSINCTTPGATIYYTLNGNDPTTSSTVYSTAIQVSTTTTIKAIATANGMDNSSVGSAVYVFGQSAPNIAAFIALADNTVATITGPATVVTQQTTNLFVQDDSGWLLVYGNAGGKTFHNGDQITGITGKRLSFGTPSYPEMDITGMTIPDGVAGSPAVAAIMTPATITNNDINRYVAFNNVQIAANVTFSTTTAIDGTIVNGTGTMIIRDNYKLLSSSFVAGDMVDLKGIVRSYNSVLQIYLLEIALHGTANVDNNLNKSIKIYANNGNIVIDNAKAGQRVEVYNVAGQLLVSQIATDGKNTISTVGKGMLIVRCGDKTGKIVL